MFENLYTPLCLFAGKYVEDEHLAADIVQDCFIKLWQVRSNFSYLHSARSFLYAAVRNRALNEIEHFKVVDGYAEKVAVEAQEAFFQDNIIEEETYRILIGAVEQLPPQMKAVILLVLEGKTNPEIAETLNVSTETVKSLRKIAYKKLRILVGDYYYLFPAIFEMLRGIS